MFIYNATIVNEGLSYLGWVRTDGALIAGTGHGHLTVEQAREKAGSEEQLIDAEGMFLLPGVIDEHVHFRDPGMPETADLESESRAAVAGGVTSYMDMPNTRPATTSIQAWNDKMQHAGDVSAANYAFYMGATADNMDQIAQADPSYVPCLKVFMGQSTGNMKVDADVLDRLFEQSPLMIAVHAEDTDMIAQTLEEYARRYDGQIPYRMHAIIRSREACLKATQTAIGLSARHHHRLHILHVTTAEEVRLLQALRPSDAGLVTAETCPHYLTFCDADYDRLEGRIKCNPSVKTASDREALLDAVRSGVIDTVGSDHAPHPLSAKQRAYADCPSGMPSVQFVLPVMLQHVAAGRLTWERLVSLMSHRPAEIFHVDRRGFIRPGYYADMVLVRERAWTITDEDVVSRCGWTPYVGMRLTHQVDRTIINGRTVYHAGRFTPYTGMPLRFNP